MLSSEFPPGPGGIGTHAFQVASELASCGWHISVVAPQDYSTDDAVLAFNRALPFPIKRLRQFGPAPVKLPYRLACASAAVRKEHPDVIIATGERMVWLAAAVSALHRLPFVAIGHAMEFNAPTALHRAINRRAFEAARAVVCVSRYTRSRMESSRMHVSDTFVIPNGADEKRYRVLPDADATAFRAQYGLGNAILLVTVGSVHERKGQDVMIRAMPRVLERFPDVRYVCVGAPFRKEAFSKIARELGVADRVHFLGVVPHEDVVRALNAASLFVMTSQHTPNGDFEGYGIAVVEAALCGRAAVVSDNSGVMEAIEPDDTGLVARISDPVSTADRVIELLSDRTRLLRMGTRARERAIAEKTWKHRGAEYDGLLRGLMTKR